MPSLRNYTILVGAETGGINLIEASSRARGASSLDTVMLSLIFGQGRSDHAVLARSGVPSVFFTDANKGFIVGNLGTILSSTDGGNTWTDVSTGTTISHSEITFADAINGWIVGSKGTILNTSDGGTTWKKTLFANENAGVVDLLIDIFRYIRITSNRYLYFRK